MIELTPEAQRRLDKYLDEVKTYLQACPSVDGEDVRRDIIGHIEAELEGCDRPVDADKLGAILERLGSPRQWVPEEEISWWRKILLRLRRGPEDWRLAYITFGLLVLGVLLGWVFCDFYGGRWYRRREFNEEIFIFFAVLSFITARATLAVTPEREKLSAQKWLIYPPLLLVYLCVGILLLVWPVAIGCVAFEVIWRDYKGKPSMFGLTWKQFGILGKDGTIGLIATCIATLIGAVWWFLMSLVFLIRPGLPRVVFRPFLDRGIRKVGIYLLVAGLFLFVLCAAMGVMAMLYYYY